MARVDTGAGPIRVEVVDDRRVSALTLLVDGAFAAESRTPHLERCVELGPGEAAPLLAVAQVQDTHPATGWAALELMGPRGCSATTDAMADAAIGVTDSTPPPDVASGPDGPPEGRRGDAGDAAEMDGVAAAAEGTNAGCRASSLPFLLLPLLLGRRQRRVG